MAWSFCNLKATFEDMKIIKKSTPKCITLPQIVPKIFQMVLKKSYHRSAKHLKHDEHGYRSICKTPT